MSEQLIQDLNIQTKEELDKFLLSTMSWAAFAEAYFMNPDDIEEPLVLEPGQIKAINALQFGYDIESVPENYVLKNPPKIVVMIWPRQTGKTSAVAFSGSSILCLQPGVKIGVMGMSEESAKNVIDRLRLVLTNSPFKSQIAKSLKMEIHMKHGGYIKAHSTSQGIRGQSYHYLFLDEAAQIDDDIIMGAALDTTRKIGKRVVMLSTPKGYRGTLVQYYTQGLRTRPVLCKNCFAEFTQASFMNANFGAMAMSPGLPACIECGYHEDDAQFDPDDVETKMAGQTYFFGAGDYTVISINPWTCSFYPKADILAELHRRGNTPIARQELLGEIIVEGQTVFRKPWIDSCTNESIQNIMKFDPNTQYMAGIDFGKIHDNSVICIGHEDRRSKRIILDYLRIIRADERGKEYEDIRSDIMEVISFYKPIWLIPDSTGMGEPVVEIMEKDLRAAGWHGRVYSNKNNRLGFIFDMKSKPDLIENLVSYFARGKIEIPPPYEVGIDVLINELLNFSYEMTQANYIKYGVQIEHDDTVIALALMVWGHRHKPWIPVIARFGAPRGMT